MRIKIVCQERVVCQENMKSVKFWRFMVALAGGMAVMMVFMYSRLGNVKRHMTDTRCYDCDFNDRFKDIKPRINVLPMNFRALTTNITITSTTTAIPIDDRMKNPIPYLNHEKTVAIGVAITTRGHENLREDNMETEMPFFRSMLASFCRTASFGYDYHLYLSHDEYDPFFHQNHSHVVFERHFEKFIGMNCPRLINITLHLVECDHTGKPAWAQNDAMMEAYMDNMAYYYRINDDTIMETTGWTERLIEQLARYNPPNVGVAGPWFRDGNIAILTHDFVHRTHIDIFGFYYPRVFTDWFADDWITGVYWPERCRKVPGTRVKHTMEVGSRYVAHFEKANRVAMEVEIGKTLISRWMIGMDKSHRHLWPKDSKNIISMSLYGKDEDYLYGALRYAQLTPIIFKGWRLRVYVEDPANKTVHAPVKAIYLKKLDNMGVEIIKVDNTLASALLPNMWRYLIADDMGVERFLVRDPSTRPSDREAKALEDWMKRNDTLHCIRDHPMHANKALVPGLIGGVPKKLKDVLGAPWENLMKGFNTAEEFLNSAIWPKVKDHCKCHDSVACHRWPNTLPYPILRKENEYVGQFVDADDQSDQTDDSMWNKTYILPDCVFIQDTGFKVETVKSVISHRPILWSQDYHVTPVMDMKALLKPIGVKLVDNSLSFYCAQVGTCAKGLKIINRDNGMRLTPELIQQFYNVYKDDYDMKKVTAFVCTLPTAMCEAFMNFNKSIIIISTIRYEQGRPEPVKWNQLNKNLMTIAQDSKNVVGANNMYDIKYLEYFTGIKGLLVPMYCGYLTDSYNPTRKQFLISPIHSTELSEKFYMEFDETIMRLHIDILIVPLRELYPQYLFADIASHPGIVYIPYQVSMASLTEQYRMNVPLFFPTLDLLSKWHVEYQIVRQRTWAGYMMKRSSSSLIPGVKDWPDPNNDVDFDAVKYWLKFADYYQLPHIIYFESIEDLVLKIKNTDLKEVSRKMKEFNDKLRHEIKDTWSDILQRISPKT